MIGSRPVAAASTKRSVQLASAIIALYYIVLAFSFGKQIGINSENGPPEICAVRLRVLVLRDPGLHLIEGNNLTFGLMKNGCPIHSLTPAFGSSNLPASLVLNTEEPMHFDGYFIEIPHGPTAADPVRWIVEVCRGSKGIHDDGDGVGCSGQWKAVSASDWDAPTTMGQLFQKVDYPTSLRRGERMVLELRHPWTWVLAEVGGRSALAYGWLVYCLAGFLRREQAAVVSLSGLYALDAVMLSIAAGGSWEEGDWRSAVSWMIEAIVDIFMAVVFCSLRQRLIGVLICCGVLKLFGKVCF